MGKRKRKIVRPSYTAKTLRIKQAPKKPVPKELKIGLAFCAGALVLAVILFFALYNDGSLPMENGEPVLGGERWLVANVGTSAAPKYYKVGEVDAPQGFHQDGEAEWLSSLLVYTFRPEAEQSPVSGYSVVGINRAPHANAESARANYVAYGAAVELSDIETMQLADGRTAEYFVAVTQTSGEGEPTRQQLLVAYIPSARETSVMISATVNIDEAYPQMPQDEIAALLDAISRSITLEE